jgi:hypothetical protein
MSEHSAVSSLDDQETFAARQRERISSSPHSGRSAPNLVSSRVLTPEIHTRLAQMKQLLRNAGGGRSYADVSDAAVT